MQQTPLRRAGDHVAVQGEDPAIPDRQRHLVEGEPHAQFFDPESMPPPVMVAPHHRHRDSTRQALQRGGHPESFPRDHPAVGEPELEEVAVDQQRIAQFRNTLQELQQRRLGLRRRVAKVSVRDDDESLGRHGGKLPVSG